MKKIIKKVCGLLSFAIALNTLTPGVDSITSVINAAGTIKGDVNCDGIISGVDALSMRQYLLGQNELDDKVQINSDIDDNGKINIVDMILITEMLISNTGETTTTSESDTTVITTSDQTVTSAVTTSMTEQEIQPVTTTAPDQTTMEKVTTTPKQTTTKVTTIPKQTTTKVTTTPKQTTTKVTTTPKQTTTKVTTTPKQTTTKVTTTPKQTTTKVTTTPKQTTTKVTTTPKQTTTAKVTTTPKQIPADTPNPLDDKLKASIFKLVNEEREKNGSKPVNLDITLSYVADIRASELSVSFDTARPDGSSYKNLLNQYGIIALCNYQCVMSGHKSASSVLDGLLERGAFLDDDYKKIGIGYYSGSKEYITILMTS